jgi:DNA-binding transcriptional regulator YbjK
MDSIFEKRRRQGLKMKAYLKEHNISYETVEDNYEKLYKLFKRVANRELKQLRKKLKETLEMEEAAQILLSMKNGN